MARLAKEMGISDTLVQKLKQNKVFTVIDYLQEDTDKLSSMSNTSFKEILEVRRNLIGSCSAIAISGTSAYERMLANSALIPNGINSLDELLDGGFLTGMVYELCGLSSDGKTQLCFALAANVAAVLKQSVHYIDSKGDFSATRVHNIIKHKNVTEEESTEALRKITVTRVSDLYELIHYLHHLKKSIRQDDSLIPRVVIVDSITSLYLPFMSGDINQGFGLLNQVMSTMKTIATDYHILFIVVNIASTFYETEASAEDGEGVSDVRPMLGKYWLHAPHTRLLVTKLNNEATQRLVRVIKSTYLPLGASCVVNVSEKGVQ